MAGINVDCLNGAYNEGLFFQAPNENQWAMVAPTVRQAWSIQSYVQNCGQYGADLDAISANTSVHRNTALLICNWMHGVGLVNRLGNIAGRHKAYAVYYCNDQQGGVYLSQEA